ncbi:MAG: ribosome-binding factor A [Bacteroidetes bacterium GWF2_41_61]|jgi:ribosome-binding factor A|nr:MAG: ribosome-binding factor A [Bacteroidetes bacterium GWE2_40_15]OFY28178.1 MAG: ribosome-binding factor A [Bacteroidetes bacterium GWF2_41_61]OFY88583.1 MAG: ribosome-binding factor A [Bacteroidetes bacterium RIFOXYA12_FULL_40_10]OFZ08372.1 MAG: ribosome-binding factor A [Bacteroidetes bacterium RIFOXYB2_FULL_39_7]PKO99543.1 MAG: ribosome-binding factor A [Bacteroidetes bacterium HGW-Bacteroidetes-8]PKP07215.1 MAG: ribosome-binding factor A [Bacteroidetes bacterium HGW-Bacteroidetes-5]H
MEGESTRQHKVSRQLQRDLSEIFREKGTSVFKGTMITVTSVRISPDLSVARVFLSIFPSAKSAEVFKIVQDTSKALRGELGKRVSKQLRIVPDLVFIIDDSLDYVERIEELLKK